MITRAELAKVVAARCQVSKQEARSLVEVILDSVVRALRRGERVELRGFGSFATHTRAARKGRNPKSGLMVPVPPRRVPHFKPGAELKALVNGGGRPAQAVQVGHRSERKPR